MYALNADAPLAVADVGVAVDLQVAVEGQGKVILGYLVALHQVGVWVVLAVKLGEFGDAAVQGQAGHHGVFHGAAVDDGQRAGQAEADRAGAGVGLGILVVGGTGAEHLAAGVELDVDLEANDGFVLHRGVPLLVEGLASSIAKAVGNARLSRRQDRDRIETDRPEYGGGTWSCLSQSLE